jgi:hypothetical protein
MSSNNIVQDAIFWVSIATLSVGLIKYTLKYCIRFCKCNTINFCWGMCSGTRDIAREIEIEKARIDAHINDDSSDDYKTTEYKQNSNDVEIGRVPQSPSRSGGL